MCPKPDKSGATGRFQAGSIPPICYTVRLRILKKLAENVSFFGFDPPPCSEMSLGNHADLGSQNSEGHDSVFPPWRRAGLRYYALGFFLREKFGRRVWKLSVDAGCSCPNVDGTKGTTGCIFCDLKATAPSRRFGLGELPVGVQLKRAMAQMQARRKVDAYIAYFQPGTNTYGNLARLRALWEEAASLPGVVGVAIGTRPDALSEEVLDTLEELNRFTWVQIELGVQTVHDRSLRWLERHHTWAESVEAIISAKKRGLFVVSHVILGIPGETLADQLQTARQLGALRVDGVKIHNLHVLRHTRLEKLWRNGVFEPMSREEYIRTAVEFLENLPPMCVIERLVGDAPAEFLLAPKWSLEKSLVLREIEAELARRGSFQGSAWCLPARPS